MRTAKAKKRKTFFGSDIFFSFKCLKTIVKLAFHVNTLVDDNGRQPRNAQCDREKPARV